MITCKSLSEPEQPKRGRPLLHEEPMKRVNVMIDAETEHGLKSLGDGNLSAGIRAAWQMLKRVMPSQKKPWRK